MSIIGIDLGTTYSAVAQLDDLGRPTIVSIDGESITPSVVEFTSDTSYTVGKEAKKVVSAASENVIQEVKREIGSKEINEKKYNFFGEQHNPTTISSLILKFLKEEIEKSTEKIHSAVITVPANFSKEAREATQKAADMAGIPVEYIINEPTAAALNYAFQSGESLSGNYLIYDFGGGTFDCSIANIKGKEVEILSSEGVSRLGGKDFDEAIRKIVIKKYKDEHGKELDEKLFDSNKAEDLKISLSRKEKINAQIGLDAIEVTRDEFLTETSSLIMQAELAVETALQSANLKKDEINEVILVGGTSRIPAIQESISKFFEKEPRLFGNPDEAVALGAAVYAAYKANPDNLNQLQKKSISEISLQEITPYYLGTLAIDEATRKEANLVIIPKGEKTPCSLTTTVYTNIENQAAVNCRVTQASSYETSPEFVRIIANGLLNLRPNLPDRSPIEITFSFTEDGHLNALFSDGDGENIHMDLEIKEPLEDEFSIDKFKVD